jgi:N-methylhydantoinase A
VPTFVRPKPVVERKHRFEVTSGSNADGSVLVPLDMASVDRALDAALDAGAEAIAVCMLHAYLNPEHEHAVADAAKGKRPGCPCRARPTSWPSTASSSASRPPC